MKQLKINKKLILAFFLASLIPLALSLSNIYFGRIAFWYDPARDFLLALQNLEKPTFIGQPSGLPGLFYGPYWIWTISLWTLVSKDPRIVSFLLLTIPYFTIFPIILYQISRKWGIFIFLSIWFLFIFNFGSYASQIWNVHYAAFFLLLVFYFLINPNDKKYKNNIDFLFLGISTGLVANFHLSFGIPLVVGIFISILLTHFLEYRKNILKHLVLQFKKLALYFMGILFSFAPFTLFEIRHDFIQTRTFLTAVTDSIIYNTASVGQTGMTDNDIIKSFLSKFTDFLSVPSEYIKYIFILIFFSAIIVPLLIKTKLYISDRRLIIGLITVSVVMLTSFIQNENPTWGYYFIGVEIFFMLFIGMFMSKMSYGKFLLIFFIGFSLINHQADLRKIFSPNNFTNSDLGTRTYIVKSIFNDAESNFQYAAYSSAIYTYEYDYLFKWQDENNEKNIDTNSKLVYIIIPKVSKETEEDFVNYKTPDKEYSMNKKWKIPDGTTIYKMVKK